MEFINPIRISKMIDKERYKRGCELALEYLNKGNEEAAMKILRAALRVLPKHLR